MSSTSTKSEVTGAESEAFVPLTESQMGSIRGGTDWPDWIVDLIDDVVQSTSDAIDYLDTIMDPAPVDFDDDYWDEVEDALQDEGFMPPDPGGM